MAFVDLHRNRLILKAVLAGPPAVGKSERLWQLGHAGGVKRTHEIGQTPLGPQRMASMDLEVEREGRSVELEIYEWHGPEKADVRGKGLAHGLDGLIYLADARPDRTVDTVRQLEFLISTFGKSRIQRIPSLLALGQMDAGLARLSALESQLPTLTWGHRLEVLLEDEAGFVEAVLLLGELMIARMV